MMDRLYLQFVIILLSLIGVTERGFSQDHISENKLTEYPVLWQQNAAEYRALCYQAFNVATWQLDKIPKKKLRKGRLAIITDLDETIIDNSCYEAQLIKDGAQNSRPGWVQWSNRSIATAVPGAAEFLQHAARKNVAVFYISNRDTSELSATLKNLQKLQLPNADTAHCLFLSNTSSKEARRQKVMEQYEVVLLLGDNLNDFMSVFEKKSIPDRIVETDKVKSDWGAKFIVLPNVVYGEWLNALYNYQTSLIPAQKELKRKSHLRGYR